MSTPSYVDSETITQADGSQNPRVPVPLPDDPYVAVRQAQLVDTDTESDLEESPSKVEELYFIGFHHTTVTRSSTYSCFTYPYTYLSFIPPDISELILDTDSTGDELREEDTKEDEEDESLDADDERKSQGLDDEGHGLGNEDHGLGDKSQGLEDEGLGFEEEEVIPGGQQQAVPVVETTSSEPLGLGYRALRRRDLAVEEDQVPSTFELGQSSRSVSEQEGVERITAFRQPTLVTWVDPKDDRVYIDVPAYAPPVAPVQTPPSPEWSLGSLPVSPSSPVVPSPIASLVATPTATISVDEDQFIEVGAQLKLYRSILHDHTQRLDALPPTLVVDIDRDVRELYTRSGVVRDEIFSQRYMFRSLEREQERTAMTFGTLWRPVLALEAWAWHIDTRLADTSRD
ncbi:hypothetical protein Tco_1424684, partial [Tanacetum coccineum]